MRQAPPAQSQQALPQLPPEPVRMQGQANRIAKSRLRQPERGFAHWHQCTTRKTAQLRTSNDEADPENSFLASRKKKS
ncbi:hypothetical protein [Komagataeibacter europaeus]|uniref:hypothetical protein n=1 Tax=Komagataeibacter europaeus TaxID=33995 RepID=UPI0015F8A63C|nr:hypothetical protein [Komagataeibacter europaeus]